MNEQFCPYCMAPVTPGESCPSCGLTAGSYVPSAHHLPPGTVLMDRYLVGRVLGEGGFGITYIGCDLRLELKIAIKEYYPADRATRNAAVSLGVTSFMGPSAQSFQRGKEKFLGEARTMARLDKQHAIVGVRDHFEANNTAYIVMEYIEGTTFSDLVKQRGGRIQPQELFAMLEPLFGALGEMHSHGLIHRDISPDNLMLEHGAVRLLDFGCARETTQGTETMTVALKQGYAPVEQYQTKGQGPWTDIYALCATIYYYLTGQAPPQALDRVAGDTLQRPSKLGVHLQPYQEEALLKGLEIRPNRRYQSAETLHGALYPSSPPAPDPPPPIPTKWGLWVGVGAAALVLLLVMARLFGGAASAPPPAVTDPVLAAETTAPAATQSAQDRFSGAQTPTSYTEENLRSLMENDDVSAIILPAGSYIRVETGALEITKPLYIRQGATLNITQPVTVAQDAFVQVDGALDILMLRVHGTVSVGSGGEIGGDGLVWMDRAECLTVAEGGSAELAGVSYDGQYSGERFLIMDEEELFANAREVRTFRELQNAVDRADVPAVIIAADMDLTERVVSAKPILIQEGVTVRGNALYTVDEDERDNLLLDSTVLINRGSLQCSVNAGDWDEADAPDYGTLVNYGELLGDLFLTCPGQLINYGSLDIAPSQVLGHLLFNLGQVLVGDGNDPGDGWVNIYCSSYNFGTITVAGDDYPRLTIQSGAYLYNVGTMLVGENGLLENYGWMISGGLLEVSAGGCFENSGFYESLHSTDTLRMHPESTLRYAGLFQVGAGSTVTLPNARNISAEGGRFVTFCWADSPAAGEYLRVTTEAELRRALANDQCKIVCIESGELTVNGDLTLQKKVVMSQGLLHIRNGSLRIEGADGFLYGAVDLDGGQLTVTDGAMIIRGRGLSNCGGLTIDGQGLVVNLNATLLENIPITLDQEGQLINQSSLELRQVDLRIESGVLRTSGWLHLNDCDVTVEEQAELLGVSTQLSADRDTTIVNRGIVELYSNHGWNSDLSCTVNNYGSMMIEDGPVIGGSLTNYGTLHFRWSDCTITGTLDNQGTVRTEECDIHVQGGTYSGAAPKERAYQSPRR